MSEETNATVVGEGIATALMLRQLYVLAAKLHDVGGSGMAAWRDDVLAQIKTAETAAHDATFQKVAEAARNHVESVFQAIT
ncbi:MAG: hypothetical protein AB1698_16145 [Pseudomonadota bacterium]